MRNAIGNETYTSCATVRPMSAGTAKKDGRDADVTIVVGAAWRDEMES